MRKTIKLVSLAIAGVLASSPTWAARLESPAHQAVVSGIGFIGGWKCDANNITVTIDGGEHISVAMGQPRADTQPICGTINNGFIQQINWALVGDGEHEAVAYDNGVEFSRSTFTVGSTGEEFLKGAETTRLLENFPAPGETTILEWNESTQHFEIRGVLDSPMAGEYNRAWWQQYNVDLVAGTYRTEEFLYVVAPDLEACEAGELAGQAKNRALEAANQVRALHGLPALQYSSRYDQRMQEASLIQAVNGFPGHYPEPSVDCYTAEGAAGSTGSNLVGYANGYLGSRDPAADMVGWTNDVGNQGLVAGVGHRRWVLNPFTTYFAYGQVYGSAAQKTFRFDEEPPAAPRIEVDFVAFPFEVYPFNLVEGDPPWSFSVVEDKSDLWRNQHLYFETANISVVRGSDEASLVITDRYTDIRGVGVPNVLSWQVAGWEYDTLYEVEISNVALRSGAAQSYSYPVFIDRANLEY